VRSPQKDITRNSSCTLFSRLATQHEITEAYERLIYSPSPPHLHENRSNSNADPPVALTQEERFKLIARAYQVLSDPNKRIQYDREGMIDDNEEYSGLDVQNLGGIGRVFGAMISRLGVPLPTQVSKEILQTAAQICRSHSSLWFSLTILI
jgi:DnaJ-class molecular chaperone